MQTLQESINQLKVLSDKEPLLFVNLFCAVNLENSLVFGVHFSKKQKQTGEKDHFDHGVGINKNVDLCYIYSANKESMELSPIDNNEVLSLCIEHNNYILDKRKILKQSSLLNESGFSLYIDSENNIIELFKKENKEKTVTFQHKKAENIILYTKKLAATYIDISFETICRAYFYSLLYPQKQYNVCDNSLINSLLKI